MTERQFQALDGTGLVQPGVSRQAARVADHMVPGTGFTLDELHYYQLRGRRLQARAVATGLSRLFRAALRPVARLARGIAQARRRGAAIRQLSALDDHLLGDIGITRGQIPAVVDGLQARTGAEDTVVRAPAASVLAPRRRAQVEACNDASEREAA